MMKRFYSFMIAMAVSLTCLGMSAAHANEPTGNAPRVGIVNFKKCVEESMLGKQERDNFDALRKQMESTLEEKEKQLSDLTKKFNDPDYLDSLSPDAEEQAKNQYRTLSQEMAQLQQQYYQTLNQTNLKVVQKLADQVAAAAERVAKKLNLDLVLNEESSFFYSTTLDISTEVIKTMDAMMETTINS